MRKLHYKGRCTKRRLSKCKDICRTYDAIQTLFAEWLQENDEIACFQCNVKIENDSEDQYTSDFYAELFYPARQTRHIESSSHPKKVRTKS